MKKMSQIKIGWSEVDITPNKKISLAGQFFERISDEVESRLYAIATAVESDGEVMVLCALDLVSVSDNLYRIVKERFEAATGVSGDKVILSAIHTHTSYTYGRESNLAMPSAKKAIEALMPEDMKYVPLVSGEESMDPDEALEIIANGAATACINAYNSRKEGYYKNAFGRVAVGMCRRVCYDDGSAKMWGDTNHPNFTELEGGNDSGMELIFTFDNNKKLTGVIANIACPSQVVEHRSFISSDYWGKVRENIKKKYGNDVAVLGLCSAAGDQCPRDMIRWVNPESPIDDPNIKRDAYIERVADPSMFDLSGLRLVGRRISNEIISVFEELDENYVSEAPLIHKTLTVTMPLRRVTISEYNEAIGKIQDFIDKNRGKKISFEENAMLHIYSGTITRYEMQKTVNTYEDEIHIIRLGDVAIATNPYELFLDYGNKIRARSYAKQTFLIQLACGSCGYLPTEKAEKGSHYSAYVSSGRTGHEGGDLLVRTTLETINKMFK